MTGMVASLSSLQVMGVTIESKKLKGLDSLLSIVQMPRGCPVATMAINGSMNAGLLAASIIGNFDEKIKYQISIVSAHRTPKRMFEFAESASKNGFGVIIAGA